MNKRVLLLVPWLLNCTQETEELIEDPNKVDTTEIVGMIDYCGDEYCLVDPLIYCQEVPCNKDTKRAQGIISDKWPLHSLFSIQQGDYSILSLRLGEEKMTFIFQERLNIGTNVDLRREVCPRRVYIQQGVELYCP